MKLTNLWRTARNWLRMKMPRPPARPKWLDALTDDELAAMRHAFELVHRELVIRSDNPQRTPFICHALQHYANDEQISVWTKRRCVELVEQQLDGSGTLEGYLRWSGSPKFIKLMRLDGTPAGRRMQHTVRIEWIERTLMPMLWRKQ